MVETLTAMTVFLVAVLALWGLSTLLGFGFSRSIKAAVVANEAIVIDQSLTAACEAINPSFWVKRRLSRIIEHEAVIPLSGDEANGNLNLNYSDKVLYISYGTISKQLKNIEELCFYPIERGDSVVIGLKTVYKIGSEKFSSSALFRSTSLIDAGDE